MVWCQWRLRRRDILQPGGTDLLEGHLHLPKRGRLRGAVH